MTEGLEKLLRATGLFDALDDAGLRTLAAKTQEIQRDARQVVVREGDPGDALYVVVEGDVQVFRHRPGEREVVLARLGPGRYFGELALLPERAGLRTASVRAATKVRLLRVDRATFLDCLAHDAPLRERLRQVGEAHLYEKLARESRLFRALQTGTSPVAESDQRRFAAGEVIFRQGDPSDAIYLILEGRVGIHEGERRLAVLETGQCFGELGLLARASRTATARAETDCRLMTVSADRYQAALDGPEVGALFTTLKRLYKLPNRGRRTQGTGTLQGREAVTNVYELDDGRCIVVACVFGEQLYNADDTSAESRGGPAETLRFEGNDVRRELRLDAAGKLVGITAQGSWPGVAELQRRLLDGTPLAKELLARFPATGEVPFDGAAPASDTVCQCMDLKQDAVVRAIRGGCSRLASLQDELGCGTICGGCRPRLVHLLGNEKWTPVRVAEERQLTRDVRKFRLQPVDGKVIAAKAGQHIVVSALVAGNWLERPYTLTSMDAAGHYEIIVKREPHGALSRWLFDEAGDDALFRVSPPQGMTLPDAPGRPVVLFVAGIGMTPALALLRARKAAGRTDPLVIDYSARTARDLIEADELRGAAAGAPWVTLQTRFTSSEGRLAQPAVNAIQRRFPGAAYFVCGPDAYMAAVTKMLEKAGVAPADVLSERFTPVAGKPPRPRATSWIGKITSLFAR